MYWAAVAVLLLFGILLWVQQRKIWKWSNTTSNWLNKHYDHHVRYFQDLSDKHPHPDWREGPTNGGEGNPPPFP